MQRHSMKQIIQSLKDGKIEILNTPCPKASKGQVVIQSISSLVSLGTERMLLNFGKASYLDKARQQPDKVKMVIDKVKTDGLKPTIEAVQSKLNTPIPLGYSNVGLIIDLGEDIKDLKIGDRVISNGNHSEVIKIPRNLCAKVPDNVSNDNAVFTVVSSIALQGTRLATPTLGENFLVIGLGLLGIITCKILQANGCNVIGIDLDEDKLKLANSMGIDTFKADDNSYANIMSYTNKNGVDGVIITASTESNEPIDLAPKVCRQKARVVLVGVVGLRLNRTEFFKKEISFQVSCSYGPGRYDSNYESKGLDYPIGYVRWTENRNFNAILKLMESGRLDLSSLITKRVKLDDAPRMYENIQEHSKNLGILIEYDPSPSVEKSVTFASKSTLNSSSTAFIGAGGFSSKVLVPKFLKNNAKLKYISSSNGLSGSLLARQHNIEVSTTDNEQIFNDNDVSNIVITTPHNSHGKLVLKALKHNKNVFVEKPLTIKRDELEEIRDFFEHSDSTPLLMVGFNRRFSPLTIKLKENLNRLSSPLSISMTINAGSIPREHWIQDNEIGGGRLIGEACHFIDLARYISNSNIESSSIVNLNTNTQDTFSIILKFKNGSIANINYFSNGNKSVPKEKIEVYCQEHIFEINNFKYLKIISPTGKQTKIRSSNQDKGHDKEVEAFLGSLKTGIAPISLGEIFEVTEVTLKLNDEINI